MSNLVLFLSIVISHAFLSDSVHAQGVDEYRLRTSLQEIYKAEMTPPRNDLSPVTVSFMLTIIALRELDPVQQILTVEGYMTMSWQDSRMNWNPYEYNGIMQLHLPTKQLWRPDIKLYNRAKISEIEPLENTRMIVDRTGKVIWVPPVSLYSICAIDFKYYPYDHHTCQMKFGSWTYDISDVDIQIMSNSSGSKTDNILEHYTEGGEWAIKDVSVSRSVKYYKCCPKPYPSITYEMHLRRRAPFYKYTIMCPVIGSVILTLATFWMSPLATERITLNCISLFILVLTLVHLSFKLPSVGENLPVIVVFCGSFVVVLTVITIFSVVLMVLSRSRRTSAVPRLIKTILQSPAATFFCVGCNTPNLEPPMTQPELTKLDLGSENYKNTAKSDENRRDWINFYQILDRMLSIILFAIIIILMISSTS